ncbi:MAG: flagellar basal-body rod protein FlgG [Deltaproteobacteria bacterium]|nr:flagellar basal-body rod protein FlgG [Deltaproteobacteria bacterium]
MIRALWTAASGMETQQLNMDVISNNLANVNTTGFKKSRPDFQDLLYQKIVQPGSSSADTENPTGIQVGLGSRTAAVQKIFTTGDMVSTGHDYDLAIEGAGFFQVELPDGETAYTRCGAFKRDSTGRLVTSEGYSLIPQITIPENAIRVTIGEDGTVTAYLDAATTGSQVGNIELALFSNPAGLSSQGKNLYKETLTSGTPALGTAGTEGYGTLAQGFLEGSNVSVMEEMVNMIAGQRAYEVNSKAVKASDEMLQMTNNLA